MFVVLFGLSWFIIFFSYYLHCLRISKRNETKRNDFCSLFYCNCFHNKDINNIAQQNEAKWCWWNLSKVSHCILSSHKMWVFNCSNSLWWCRSLSLSLSLFLSLSLSCYHWSMSHFCWIEIFYQILFYLFYYSTDMDHILKMLPELAKRQTSPCKPAAVYTSIVAFPCCRIKR